MILYPRTLIIHYYPLDQNWQLYLTTLTFTSNSKKNQIDNIKIYSTKTKPLSYAYVTNKYSIIFIQELVLLTV
jgi:hypothetical protein